jgi:hypothetical protein
VISFISFIEKSWFLWWIFATLAILRWLHVISCHTEQEGLELPRPDEQASPDSAGRSSRGRKPPRFGSEQAF